MAVRQRGYTGGASWSVEDIPYGTLARDVVRDDRRLFHLLASASFIEITSHLYTQTLVDFFQGDDVVVDWLEQYWVSEELQHGTALKRYVQTAWPDFDWETAYQSFLADYGQLCTVDQLAATRALEMVARCVVEAGTASFYRTLSICSREPVLSDLAARISTDEVRHYKHFYRYFLRYRASERPSRAAVARTLWNRTADIDAEDALYAFKAIHLAGNPDAEFQKSDYEAYRRDISRRGKREFPYEMAVKMLLKPLDLPPMVGRAVVPAVTSATRLFMLR